MDTNPGPINLKLNKSKVYEDKRDFHTVNTWMYQIDE